MGALATKASGVQKFWYSFVANKITHRSLCSRYTALTLKVFCPSFFKKLLCLLGPSGTPVPTKIIRIFPILQNSPSGAVFALKGTDIESFFPTFFQNPGNIRFYTKQRIECYVRTIRHRIKSFLPLFFSKKRAGLGAAPHKNNQRGLGQSPII